MLKICHRRNTIEQLKTTPKEYGVEMDIHAYGDRLTVHHDAFVEGIDFEEWLDHYQHRFVILNIKEEGIESRVRELVLKRGITDFFMLDLSFPALVKMLKQGEKRTALRISLYEPIEGALRLQNMVNWLWIDLFTEQFPINANQYEQLKQAGFKFCLVSPELLGREQQEIIRLKQFLNEQQIKMDAVCTKVPECW